MKDTRKTNLIVRVLARLPDPLAGTGPWVETHVYDRWSLRDRV
jgi:hypothetical protein